MNRESILGKLPPAGREEVPPLRLVPFFFDASDMANIDHWQRLSDEAHNQYTNNLTYIADSVVCPPKPRLLGVFKKGAEQGLFAACNIPAGTFLGEYGGRSSHIVANSPDTPVTYKFNPHTEGLPARVSTEGLGKMNHSRHEPNVEPIPGTYYFRAIRDIAEGEELTWKYGDYDIGQPV